MQDLYSKIGRNLILYQTIEKSIKSLLIFSNITFKKIDNDFIHTDNSIIYKDNTFGTLVDAFFKKYILPDDMTSKKETEQSDIHNDIYLSTSFTTTLNKESHLNLKKQLNQLVADRNNLVHNYVTKVFDKEHIQKNKAELDEDYKKASSTSDYIVQMIKNRNKSIEYALSSHLELTLFYPEIFECLSDIYQKNKNTEEWCQFNLFINEINEKHRHLCDEIKSEYKFNSWSHFLEKLGLIELQSTRRENKTILYFRLIS